MCRLLITVFSALIFLNGQGSTGAQASLEPGKPRERELSGGQSHIYKIAMISGQYLQITVEQRGIDLTVALYTPEGKKIAEVDRDQVIEGSETVFSSAESTGAYLIELAAFVLQGEWK
jgi:hypothetical protein